MTSRWYVVQTQPHAESKAMAHLIRQGFAAYLPRYLKRRRHARKVETVEAPLFPRYLFVTVDMETQRWRSIHSTFGVSRLVCNGDEPAPVPPAVVAALQAREDAGGLVQLERRPRFAPGEQVRIVDGVFAELSRSVRRHGRSGTRCDPARPAGTQGQDPAGRRRHHGGLTRRDGRAAGQKRLGEPRFTRTAVAYGLRTGCR